MANETTTKFKVDISELKSQFQEASRQVRIANSEFKAATAGMDNWTKSADGVSAKTKQLTSVLTAQKSQLQSLEQQYALVTQEQGENSKGAQELLIKINNQKAAISKTESELKKYENSLNEIKGSADNAGTGTENFRTASEKLEDTIAGQEKQLEFLKKQYTDTVLVQGKSSDTVQKLESKISALSGELAQNKAKLKDAAYGADDLADSIDDAGDSAENAESGFTVLKGALASLVADGIKTCISGLKDLATELLTDGSSAYAGFAAATGTAADAMGEYKKAIENVYMDNFGESLQDVAEKMTKVKEVTGELDASKLQDMTEKVITLEDTFDMDMTETLRGVNSLMNHFGLTAEEAFDLMASGAQNGLNYTDELGDNVSEYAGKFAEAGFSSEEYFQLLKNGAQGGAYNLDKVNDAVNEVTTRLADGTIADSLGSFSKGTRDVFKSWQNGEATQKDVMAAIVSDIQNTTNEQDKMNLAALAFGTMAEDGGTKFIEALSPVGDTFADVKGKADELAAVKYDTPIAAIQGIGRTLKIQLLGPLVDSLMPKLNELAAWITVNLPVFIAKVQEMGGRIQELGNFISMISPLLAGIGAALAGLALAGVIQNITSIGTAIKTAVMSTKLATAAQWLWNAAMNANPIGLIVIAIAGLVAAFAVLWNKSDAFRNFWIGVWDKVKAVTSDVVDAIVKFFTITIPKAWDMFLTFLSGFITNIVTFFSQLPGNIWTWLSNATQKVSTWASNMKSKAQEVGSKFLQTIVTFFKQLPGKIWSFLSSAVSKAANFVSQMGAKARQAGSEFLSKIASQLQQLPGKVAGFLSQVISKLSSWVGDMGRKGAQAARSLFNNVVNGLAGLPGQMASIGSNLIQGLWNGISNMSGWIASKIQGFGSGVLNSLKNFFGIHSPSRVFRDEIGKNLVLGVAEGVAKNTKKAVSSVKEMGKELLPEAQKQMKLFDGIGINSNSLSAAKRSISTPVSSRNRQNANGTDTQNVSNTTVFNQYNNSPKALSRLEIYRQTRNQLNFARGV